jgi:2-methylcitrate dehydratase PrpD
MQAAIEAAAFLSTKISNTAQIKSIEIGVHGAMLGKLTSNTPVDFQQAQLSTPFAVAMALTIAPQRKDPIALSIDDYEQSLSNQAIINLAKLCQCMIDTEVEAKTTTEAVPARVVCILHNGERLEHFIEFPKGCPQNPITQLEVAQRFTSVARPLFGSAACDDWLNHAMHAKDLKSVQPLLTLQPLVE